MPAFSSATRSRPSACCRAGTSSPSCSAPQPLLAGLAIFTAEARLLAFYYCLGVVGVFAVFAGLGTGITWAARRMPRPRRPELALAIGNLGAPGGLTRSVVLSLGTGLSLLVTVALVDASIINELTSRLPEESPNYFVLDIKRDESGAFLALIEREAPGAKVQEAPMLRGRLVKLGDRPVPKQIKAPPEVQWVLNGDRGLSYSATVPDGSTVVAGEWWPADWSGEPLVSFEADIAKGLRLKIGDTRHRQRARPQRHRAHRQPARGEMGEPLAQLRLGVLPQYAGRRAAQSAGDGDTAQGLAARCRRPSWRRQIGRSFPASTAIRVKDAIDQFNAIFSRVMVAVRAAGSVTLLAGAIVLAGALGHRPAPPHPAGGDPQDARGDQPAHPAVPPYRVRGSRCVNSVHFTVDRLPCRLDRGVPGHGPGSFSGWAAVQAIVLATALVAVFGGFGTWRVLRAPPVPYLRSE